MLPLRYAASRARETKMTRNPADQSNSDIYGDRIVYTDGRKGNKDIYLYRFTKDP